jgi:hypothetical protein
MQEALGRWQGRLGSGPHSRCLLCLLGFGVRGSGFGVEGLGFGVWGSGLRVWGLG